MCSKPVAQPPSAEVDADAQEVLAMVRTTSLLGLVAVLGVSGFVGCAGNSAAPDEGFNNDPTADGGGTATDPGMAALAANGCAGCHAGAQGSFAGSDRAVPGTMAYGPNLTPDMDTGIGAWTDDQIVRAIRQGLDDQGMSLCTAMPRFSTLSDADAHAIVAYLRGLPAVSHMTPESQCDGTDPGGDVDASVPDDAAAPADDAAATRGLLAPDAGGGSSDAGTFTTPDAGTVVDAGPLDSGVVDAGHDAGTRDAGRDAGSPVDVPTVDAGPLGCHPLINEVLTGVSGAATNEWVELYNPCPTAISLTGWRLGYRSAANASAPSGADSSTLVAFAAQSIPSHGYLLIAGAGYTGTADAHFTSGMADAGGGVGLRDLAGVLVDSMGWGTATNAFVRVHVAAVAPSVAAPGNSLERLPDGTDTQNSAADFHAATHPTPRAANR